MYWRTVLWDHYVSSGAIIPIDAPKVHMQHVSRSFFVEKGSGGFRLVIDLKFLNGFFDFPKVKFENLNMLRHAPTQGTHAFSIDVSDAYHHLRVSPRIKNLFQFKIDGEFFIARGLPF